MCIWDMCIQFYSKMLRMGVEWVIFPYHTQNKLKPFEMGFQIYDKVLIRIPTQSSQPCFEAFIDLG